MAVLNLTFASTRATISTLRGALASDPLFQPDKTKASRAAETMVLDAWGKQVRDFPVIVVQGIPGKSRRMGFNDQVAPFFGISIFEEPGGTQTLRTIDVPLAVPVDFLVELRYSGDPTGMDPQPPFRLPVQQKVVGPSTINYVELAGANIGPPSAFPLASFQASTVNVAVGQTFGGFFDMTISLTGCARSPQTREQLADRIMSLMWLEKKRELRRKGVVVLDVAHVGFDEKPYGADLIYYTKFNASVALEFEAIAQYTETVQDIEVVGTAVDTLT